MAIMTNLAEDFDYLSDQYVLVLIWGTDKKEEQYFGFVVAVGDTFLSLRLVSDHPYFDGQLLIVRISQIKLMIQYSGDSEFVLQRIGARERRRPEGRSVLSSTSSGMK